MISQKLMRRRLHRNVYLLGFLSLFNDVTSDMITPLLPMLLQQLGRGAVFLGLMEGIASALSNMTMLLMGFVADRWGKSKRFAVAGYATSAVMRLFLAVPIPGIIFVARVIDRVGKGIRTTPRDKLLMASTEKERWGEAFGVHRSMDHMGALIGPVVAMFLMSVCHLSIPTVILVAALPSLISVLFVPRKILEMPAIVSEDRKPLVWAHLPKHFRWYLLLIFFSALSTPSELFFLLRIREQGLSAARVPLAWLLLTFFTLIAAYWGGRLADVWSRRRTMAVGWAVFAAVYVGFACNKDIRWTWVLIAIYGLHKGVLEPAERAYPAGLVREDQRATALGWYYFAYGMGLLPASLLFGFLWDKFGPLWAFLLNALLTVILIPFLLLLPSDRQKSRVSPSQSLPE